MQTRRRGLAGVTAIVAVSLGVAACGGGGGGGGSSTSTSSGSPVKGGDFKILSSSDVDYLDTTAGYYTVTYTFMRAFTRQLVTYIASNDETKAAEIHADAATDVAKASNGGKTYTFTIRDGVQWNTTPARQVTSKDFALGFKRLCNPVAADRRSRLLHQHHRRHEELLRRVREGQARHRVHQGLHRRQRHRGHQDPGREDARVRPAAAGERLPRTSWRCPSARPPRSST